MITRQIVDEQKLTTLMITHNMHQALSIGDRTLMMDGGQIVLDLGPEERRSITVQDLIDKFTQVRQVALSDDKLLLTI